MDRIHLFFVRLGWKRLDDNLIHSWFHKRFNEGLFYALESGTYRVRSEAARHLGRLKVKEAIPLSRKGIESSIMDVSLCCIEAYIEISDYHGLTISIDLQKEIRVKQKQWKSHLSQIKDLNFLTDEFIPLGHEAPWKKLVNKQQDQRRQNTIPY